MQVIAAICNSRLAVHDGSRTIRGAWCNNHRRQQQAATTTNQTVLPSMGAIWGWSPGVEMLASLVAALIIMASTAPDPSSTRRSVNWLFSVVVTMRFLRTVPSGSCSSYTCTSVDCSGSAWRRSRYICSWVCASAAEPEVGPPLPEVRAICDDVTSRLCPVVTVLPSVVPTGRCPSGPSITTRFTIVCFCRVLIILRFTTVPSSNVSSTSITSCSTWGSPSIVSVYTLTLDSGSVESKEQNTVRENPGCKILTLE